MKKVSIDHETVEMFVCDGCPCLNYDEDGGSACNLGFIVTDEVVNHNLVQVSENCGLRSINYVMQSGDGKRTGYEYVPDKISVSVVVIKEKPC
jgi:hypothetical protein